MALISIPGMTAQTIADADTTPMGGGFRPFPCTATGYTRHTAVIMNAEHKTGSRFDGSAFDQIELLVANCAYGGRIYINLNVNDVPPGTKDVEKAVERNLSTLTALVKIMGCHTQGKLDTGKLHLGIGKEIEISAKHGGFDQKDGRYFHKVKLYFNGECKTWRDVDESIGLPPLPGQQAQAPSAAQSGGFDDISF